MEDLKRHMDYALSVYKANNGKEYNYISYLYHEVNDRGDEKRDTFTNMEYFIIDVKSDIFNNIMESTGGFVANMTTRLFEKENLDVSYLMLVAIPQPNNNFVFKFAYFDNEFNLLKTYIDNNYNDYRYFKNKFKYCTIKKLGSVFDLISNEKFHNITKDISYNTSCDFDLIVDGQPIDENVILYFNDVDLLLTPYKKENLARNNIEIDHFEFKIAYNGIEFVYLKGIAIDTNGDTIKDFQTDAHYSKKGIATIEQYKKLKIKELSDYFGYQYDGPISIDDFSISISLDFAKNNSDKFSYSPELLKIKTNELDELEK